MAKKQDAYYFENFIACVGHACQAADLLHKALSDFQPEELPKYLESVHAHEHAADCRKHDLMEVLAKAFITPIEREDIILMSQNIDEIADKIEDVLIRVYCNNVRSIRPDALQITQLILRSCGAVQDLMREFADFKRSKKLREYIISINSLEEEADKLFFSCIRNLHTTCPDPMEVIAWHEVYTYLEQCMDACEHVADVVESVVMKNS